MDNLPNIFERDLLSSLRRSALGFVFTGTVRKVVFDVNPHLTEAQERDLSDHAHWAHTAHAITA